MPCELLTGLLSVSLWVYGFRHTAAMSKSAVKISSDLLSNPLCEQDPKFLEMVMALDTAMKRMDSFNQEKVRTSFPGGQAWKGG